MFMLRRDVALIVGLWLLGRVIVFGGFITAVGSGWFEATNHWDASWYGQIVNHGYDYAADGKMHTIAFFPLYPLLATGLTRLGIIWPASGLLISNFAMLAALFVAFKLIQQWGTNEDARWSVAILALMPLALFTSSAYAEPLFILLSACTLLLYTQARYGECTLAGALTSATRQFGALLAIAMIFDGLRQRRLTGAAAGAASLLGCAAFAFYCWSKFGDPFAFASAQHAWRGGFGFVAAPWLAIIQRGIAGWRPLCHLGAAALIAIVVIRRRMDLISVACGATVIAVETWIWWYDTPTILLIGIGGLATLVFSRRIGATAVTYAVLAIAALFVSGVPFSVDRATYTLIPVIAALGMLARRYPALGYPALVAMACALAVDAHTFALNQWVA